MNQVLKNRTEAPFLQAVRLEVLCEYSFVLYKFGKTTSIIASLATAL